MKLRGSGAFPEHRYPADPWRLIEAEPDLANLGVTETLFAVGNGYIGMRANPSEGRDAHSHGTYLNGFHETWPIHHAESAVAFAKTGQTIVNAPDAKLMKLYVDDEPLRVGQADLDSYERVIDFAAGRSWRELVWRTPSGKLIRIFSSRMVSMVHRHLAVLTLEIELLDGEAPIVVSSQLLNRQDGEDEYHVRAAALGEGIDPRQARKFDQRVLDPVLHRHAPGEAGGEVILGYRCINSGMTLAAAYRHELDTTFDHTVVTSAEPDLAKTVFTIDGAPGAPIRITKFVSYHTSRGVPPQELADRCTRTLSRAVQAGLTRLEISQREWMNEFWDNSDVEIVGDTRAQQAVRWHLFQLAQASACTNELGIAAKGVTAGGYDGHYFWDTEIYVIPFLSYSNPSAARKLLRFRWHMLDMARRRATELSQVGALYPWRTINGEEASAYYAAGTAQYHINAAVAQAIERYTQATGDFDFLSNEGAEILVETARLWEDLGFYATNGERKFKIHGVTGPDEYTTVVNDNLYTNVMARFNMRFAASTVALLRETNPAAYEALCQRTGLEPAEVDRWNAAAEAMYLPYDAEEQIHPQDDNFLELEPWDFENTPDDHYPLLLYYHPLVIYRHQVLKQADVVLALFLRSEHFSLEQKRRNFEYYDPITTGDSSLSSCVQAAVAAEVGHHELALEYFSEALYLDLLDAHGNTADGVHVANSGGVWSALTHGFAGMRDTGDALSFDPRLPAAWEGLRLRLVRTGSLAEIEIDHRGHLIRVIDGEPLPVLAGGHVIHIRAGEEHRFEV